MPPEERKVFTSIEHHLMLYSSNGGIGGGEV